MTSRVTSLIIHVGVTAAAVGVLLMRREPLVLVLLKPLSLSLVPRIICGRRLRLERLGGSAAYAAVVTRRISGHVLLLGTCSHVGRPICG